jgi:hypothetical protein
MLARRDRRVMLAALALLAAVAAATGVAISRNQPPSPSAGIRAAIRRYIAEPTVVYPICLSSRYPGYARAGAYPVPVDYTFPLQLVLHRLHAGRWAVVALNDYTATGWLTRPGDSYPHGILREPWCASVPHTPTNVRAALRARRASVSTWGMTDPYVPNIGWPLYKPGSLGYSGDGAAIYYVRKWLFYGRRSARARATWDYNACNPSCATDPHRPRVRFVLTLTEPRRCRGVRAFTRLTVTGSSNTKLFPDRSWSLGDFCS